MSDGAEVVGRGLMAIGIIGAVFCLLMLFNSWMSPENVAARVEAAEQRHSEATEELRGELSVLCLDGVEYHAYYLYGVALAVAYNRDGTIRLCEGTHHK